MRTTAVADPTWTASDIATSSQWRLEVGICRPIWTVTEDLDIVSASSYDDTIAWYENDGAAPTLRGRHPIFPTTEDGAVFGVCCRPGCGW